jgi:transcriptional regulator with PAS, ATPase and Fis domain
MGSPGAFTGARKGGKKGLIEQAHKGTIFLDEIGEMPVQLQARLLRVLEEREVMRVGSDGVIPVDVRVISATNTNLEAAIARGAFREDLYYRLNTLIIHIPPLRSRTDDIAALAEEFIQHYCRKLGAPPKRLTEEAVQALQAYPWPGNVRELKNVMERIVISVDSQVVDARDVSALLYHGSGDEGRARQAGQDRQARQAGTEGKAGTEAGVNTGAGAGAVGEPEPLSDIELRAIDRALKAAGGNRTLAAKMLGISRTTLWRKLRALR